jgi:hypothetical protein
LEKEVEGKGEVRETRGKKKYAPTLLKKEVNDKGEGKRKMKCEK